jgi:tetratricopeptide (TPR) repeat protein
MKKIIALIGSVAIVGVFALTAIANSNETPLSPTVAQGQCTDEGKAAWYKDFTTFRTSDPTKAYEAAKKYLGACPTEDTDITKYLKKWVAAYDKAARNLRLQPLLYNEKKYAEAYALGKEILVDEPENVRVMIDLGYGGYLATLAKNESFNADSINFAKKAIQLIEAGKAPESWAPFKSKDETLAYLYYTIGYLNRTRPSEALPYFIKAAQFESELKKDPSVYYLIGVGYEGGTYAKLSADYKARFEGKDETPESKLALENINQVVDRMIDAYARAVALAGNNPKHEAAKKEWMDTLTQWYKYRHDQSDAGLTEMVASIMSKPLPPEPTPLTSLPATVPGSQSGVGSTSTQSTTTDVAAQPAIGSAPTQSAAKPASTPKPPGRPKRNH